MGSLHAMEYAGLEDRSTALTAHLQSNHFPPVNLVFLPVAEWAIDRAVEAGLSGDDEVWAETIVMPNDVEKTVAEVVDELHLDAFVDASAMRSAVCPSCGEYLGDLEQGCDECPEEV